MFAHSVVLRSLRVIFAVLVCTLMLNRGAFAQTLPDTSFHRLEELADQLKSVAKDSKEKARSAARHGGDPRLASSVERFAAQVDDLHDRIGHRTIARSRVDGQVEQLLSEAQTIRREALNEPPAGNRTYGDWHRTVQVLEDMRAEYRTALGLTARPIGTSGRVTMTRGRTRVRPTVPDVRTRLTDLDTRAAHAVELAQNGGLLDYLPTLQHFREQVGFLREQFNNLTLTGRRENVGRLLDAARTSQSDLSHRNVSPQLQEEWDRIIDTLVALRDDLGGTTASTSGRGTEGAVGTTGRSAPARAPMLSTDLARELDERAMRAAELADPLDLARTNATIDDFRDQVRDFANRAAGLSRDERRSAIDRLLDQAERTERELSERRVSDQLMTEWNSIVDVLLRLRRTS